MILNEDIIKENILSIYDKFGKITYTLYEKNGICSSSTAVRRMGFKSWITLVESLGLKSPRNVTKEEIIRDIKYVSTLHNCPDLSNTIYRKYGKYSLTTVNKKFESWHNALRASSVGILTSRKPSYSRNYLIKCIDDFVDRLGYIPAAHHLDRDDGDHPCSTTYYSHFNDNWQNIMSKCGYHYTGMRYHGLDKKWHDSIIECKIANLLFINKIQYNSQKKISSNRKWRCDFYLPNFDLWIEYDGYGDQRPDKKSYEEKILYYIGNKMRYLIINIGDDFASVLSEFIIINNFNYESKNGNKETMV